MESAGVLVYSIAAVVGYGDSRGYAGKQRCALFSVECELKCGGTMACFFIFFGGNKTNHKHSLYVILLKKYRETPPPAYTPPLRPPAGSSPNTLQHLAYSPEDLCGLRWLGEKCICAGR